MTAETVLLVGASGETGNALLNGLLEAKTYRVICLVRPASADKPATKRLAATTGVEIRKGSLDDSVESLVAILVGVDIVISAVGPEVQLAQKNLATAASLAKTVKRFVPCGWITACPVGGIMLLRDEKEEVLNHIKRLYLPYTYIDVGFWYEISFVPLPSGKTDYATLIPVHKLEGNPEAKNMLTSLKDIGRYVARIISDERTLNRSVSVYGEVLSQLDVVGIEEEVSGEEIRSTLGSGSVEEVLKQLQTAEEGYRKLSDEDKEKHDRSTFIPLWHHQYNNSRYVREDNTPGNAKYLGYLDVKELYPDYKAIPFKEFFQDLIDGKVRKPYAEVNLHLPKDL